MARSRWIPRQLRRFAQVDGHRRALVVEAVFWLALARIALLTMPFQRIARRLGAFRSPADGRAAAASGRCLPEQVTLAREIGWAVTRAARHLPFKAVCLPQAMAAKMMLRRRHVESVLSFGVARDAEGALQSHAWLWAVGVEVTGYPVAAQFAEIACFV